jgi:hypothetical protein
VAWSSRRTVSRPPKPFLLANIPRRQRKVDSTSNAQAFGRGRETCRCYAIGSEPSSRRRSVKLARSLSRSHRPRYHRGIRMRRRDLPAVSRRDRNTRSFRWLPVRRLRNYGPAPNRAVRPGELLYSLSILSAHSTNATKSGGVTNRAFLPSRSVSRTARAREQRRRETIDILAAPRGSQVRNGLAGGGSRIRTLGPPAMVSSVIARRTRKKGGRGSARFIPLGR